MIEPKPYLKDLFRTAPKKRLGYLRMDMNESIDGLPADFIKMVLDEIGPEFIASYPEYDLLVKKLAGHNDINPENISLSNGSDAAIKYIFDAYISPGDRVLVTDPTFAMYPVYCRMFNANAISVEYRSDLEFPYDDFVNRLSTGIRMAVIVNPNNPTGSAVDHKTLLSIIKKADEKEILLIVDEAYFYYYPHTIINEIKNYRNLIVLRTFSKLCGMAAIRLGYAAASSEIVETLRKVKPTFDINGLAVLLVQELIDRPEVISEAIETFNRGKKYLAKKLSEFGIKHREGFANFVLINCGNRTDEVIKKLAEKKILLHDRFKQDFLKDYIRVSVGSERVMVKFWDVFISIWER
jgi:histidinol-phosphate aminotransferase